MDQMSATSLISLRTLSDGTGLETERKRERRSSTGTKRTKKPASPYGSVKSLPKKQTKRTGREIWVEAVQRGGGLSNESKPTNTWRHGKPTHLANATSATPFLREQLLSASGSPLPNRVSRPGSAAARVGGTGPVYKDAESYYDEIQVLKRQLKQVKDENDRVKAKHVQMEDEIVAKSRKIEELLNPEMQSNDMRRTLTSKKSSASEVVMSLRRKIYKLEESLREKEAAVRKMKSDIKQTNVEELGLENQMFLYEIERLAQIVKETNLHTRENAISEDMVNDVMKEGNAKKTQILLKRLTEDNHGLVLENKSLKNDLMKLSSGNQTEVNIDKDYEDMNRQELLQKISSLEQCLKVEEKKISADTSELVDSESIDERCVELKGPLPQQIKQLRAREKELLAQVENLENTVKKLKEDRSHYRKKNDEYRQQLESLKSKKEDVGSDTASIRSDKSSRPKKSNVTSKKNNEGTSKVKKDIVTEAKVEELQQLNAARKIQRGWRNRQNASLQKDVSKKKDEEAELEDAIISIQASWRGHKAREAYINSLRDEYYSGSSNQESVALDDSDILLIQSALRGHSTRKQLLHNSTKRSSVSSKFPVSRVEADRPYIHQDEDEDEETDDDDDVVIGSSASLLTYRPADNLRSPNTDNLRSPKDRFIRSPNSSISHRTDSSGATRGSAASYVEGSRYKDTMEKSERKSLKDIEERERERERQNSLRNLQSSSAPWPESLLSGSGDSGEDLSVPSSSSQKKSSKKGSIKEKKTRKKDDNEPKDIANKWANSGNRKTETQGFQNRLSMRRSHQLLKDFEDDDEDEDLVVGASFHKKLSAAGASSAGEKTLLADELF